MCCGNKINTYISFTFKLHLEDQLGQIVDQLNLYTDQRKKKVADLLSIKWNIKNIKKAISTKYKIYCIVTEFLKAFHYYPFHIHFALN